MSASNLKNDKSHLTPEQIVSELDRHVIGQMDAKRALASALRNRWRRQKVERKLRAEITPRNVLMIGPTGVGKTELARRIATLAEAPFIKVEATKFTEVGYVGRDVESMVRDLVDASIKMTREQEMAKFKHRAEEAAENRILDVLLPPVRSPDPTPQEDSAARQVFRKKLRSGQLDEQDIEIDVAASNPGVEIMAPPGMEDMTSQLQSMFQSLSGDKKRRKKMKVHEAFKLLKEEEAAKFVHEEDLKALALENAEQNGIIFIDEIDKVSARGGRGSGGPDVSREGVQRDLLPLIEGCTVNTKHGMIRTDHILFITSGAFHLSRPSDLIPELQGRLPIRVELKALTVEDFTRILTEPNASLTAQYKALLATEGVDLQFSPEAIHALAEIAWQVNETTENIGARRLHTIMERLLGDLSFNASQFNHQRVEIDAAYVKQHLGQLAEDEDLSQYIL